MKNRFFSDTLYRKLCIGWKHGKKTKKVAIWSYKNKIRVASFTSNLGGTTEFPSQNSRCFFII